MTTTEHIESFKANFQSSANIRRGLSGRAVLGTVAVLAAKCRLDATARRRGQPCFAG